jgi:hypothetical protein
VLLYQVLAKLFEQLSIPLDDCFLLLSTYLMNVVVLFLKPFEDRLELFLVGENLNHGTQEAPVDVFHKSFAVIVDDLSAMLETQDGRNDVRELLRVHLAQEAPCSWVQVKALGLRYLARRPQLVRVTLSFGLLYNCVSVHQL